jgi:hypothetical protein
MKFRWDRFNIYLVLLSAALLASGCHSARSEEKKQVATLRLYVETHPDASKRSTQISIRGFNLNVESEPFVSEANIKEAKIVDVVGGFEISIQLDRQGSWLLEQYTAAHRRQHLAVFSQWTTFPDKKLNGGRYIAAPYIPTHITDGHLTFTPDATRQEADSIVLGLNHVAEKIKSESLID